MAASLPRELLDEIAGHLKNAGACLVACTAVCRRWQAAFEPIIYSDLHVYSEDFINKEGQPRGISLHRFHALTSGPGIARRGYICRLWYHIVVPFDLPDWTMRKRDGYSSDNAVRQVNDTAFQSALIDLFKTLGWEKFHRLTLILALLGRNPGQEPHTKEDNEGGLYTWFFTEGRTQAVPVYRACFHQDGALALPYVSCIDKLSFLDGTDSTRDHQIWAGAAMQIAHHCPALAEIWLNLDDHIRPDHLEYLKERRQDHSLPGNAFLHWPRLEILTLEQFQPWLPSGEWIVRPDTDEEAMIAEIEDWEAEICSYERRVVERPILQQEQFHRLFMSLGYAARHIPRLRTISFDLNHYYFFYYKFLKRAGSITLEWEVEHCGAYKSDDRVAAAWAFHLGTHQLSDWEYHATLSQWPPVEEESSILRPGRVRSGSYRLEANR
ncbi:predicted protein [Aspergillus terreus NIH2624]|uniref:Uncharacterized protein n=1 Tax=Aspergillus terreus (strain NIH 2624 / FGSC A1156) TaxID=341663 RepID=Q0C7G7_ASPTN|nr:uncharacterized protein ATEG_10367 [Aspergillus terreus NIH2624]EAU29364.1 predicted protein [Aspergillus terreus NIH2624]